MPTLMSDLPPVDEPLGSLPLLLSLPPHAVSARDRMPAVRTAANFVLRRKTPPWILLAPPEAGTHGRTLGGFARTAQSRNQVVTLRLSFLAEPTPVSEQLGHSDARQRLRGSRREDLRADRHSAVVDAQVALVQVVRRAARCAGAEPEHRSG